MCWQFYDLTRILILLPVFLHNRGQQNTLGLFCTGPDSTHEDSTVTISHLLKVLLITFHTGVRLQNLNLMLVAERIIL